jgi:hypothetical protein
MRRWWHTACAVMIAPRWMTITACRRYGRSRRPCGRRQTTYRRWSGGTTWNASCWPLKISDAAIFWSDDGAPSVPTLASSATHSAPGAGSRQLIWVDRSGCHHGREGQPVTHLGSRECVATTTAYAEFCRKSLSQNLQRKATYRLGYSLSVDARQETDMPPVAFPA